MATCHVWANDSSIIQEFFRFVHCQIQLKMPRNFVDKKRGCAMRNKGKRLCRYDTAPNRFCVKNLLHAEKYNRVLKTSWKLWICIGFFPCKTGFSTRNFLFRQSHKMQKNGGNREIFPAGFPRERRNTDRLDFIRIVLIGTVLIQFHRFLPSAGWEEFAFGHCSFLGVCVIMKRYCN